MQAKMCCLYVYLLHGQVQDASRECLPAESWRKLLQQQHRL